MEAKLDQLEVDTVQTLLPAVTSGDRTGLHMHTGRSKSWNVLSLGSAADKPALVWIGTVLIITKIAIGQTFYDLPTHLHLFYRIFHAIRINKCNFFSSI